MDLQELFEAATEQYARLPEGDPLGTLIGAMTSTLLEYRRWAQQQAKAWEAQRLEWLLLEDRCERLGQEAAFWRRVVQAQEAALAKAQEDDEEA